MLQHRYGADGGAAGAPGDLHPEPAVHPVRAARWRRVLRAILLEPLTHFILIGALIFFVAGRFEDRVTRHTIIVSDDVVARLAQAFAAQYGAAPTPAQLRALIDGHVREELFVREGTALGLDRDDEIVRRRIAQKFEFLEQDRAAPPAPTEAQLSTYYDAHRARYRHPPKRSFDQVYFAIDQRGEEGARRDAESALRTLVAGGRRDVMAGDVFPGAATIRTQTAEEVSRLFGGDGFAHDVFGAPAGRWSGPFRSGYGWHLVRVTETLPPHQRSFAEAHDDVAADWRQDARDARNEAEFRRLLSQYRVVVAGDNL